MSSVLEGDEREELRMINRSLPEKSRWMLEPFIGWDRLVKEWVYGICEGFDFGILSLRYLSGNVKKAVDYKEEMWGEMWELHDQRISQPTRLSEIDTGNKEFPVRKMCGDGRGGNQGKFSF